MFKPKEDTAKRDAQLGFVEIRMMLDKRLVLNLGFQIGIPRIARHCAEVHKIARKLQGTLLRTVSQFYESQLTL